MKKLICGPMATISHEAFRRMVEKFGGVSEHYTEMINAPSLLQHGPFEKYYLMNDSCPQKTVWQLTGNAESSMAAAAEELCSLGGIGIDINMGCCAPEIVRSGAGIAWMLKPPEEALSMVRAVKASVDGVSPERRMRLSVKLRLGAENFVPQKFFDFCTGLAESGVEQITLHPRTQKEKLSRPPKRHFAEELALLLKPLGTGVIYNGNVKDRESAMCVLKECPDVSGIMISRAAVQKPWIFSELCGAFPEYFCGAAGGPVPSGSESGAQIDFMQLGLDYIDDLTVCQPPEFFKTRMQRFFAYYCDNFSFGHYIKTKMLNASKPEEAKKLFADYFNEVPSDRFLSLIF